MENKPAELAPEGQVPGTFLAYESAGAYPQGQAPAPAAPAQPATAPSGYRLLAGILVAAVLAGGIALALGPQAASFVVMGFLISPFWILAVLAYAGRRSVTAAVLSHIWLAILSLAILLYVLMNLVMAYVKDLDLLTRVSRDPDLLRNTPVDQLFKPGFAPAILWGVLLLGLVALVSAAMLLKPVRVLVARVVPIDPDNFVHKIAISIFTLIFLSMFVPLVLLGGRPPLLEFVNNGNLNNLDASAGSGPLDLIFQFAWTLPATLIAAGWPIARTFRQTLARLGMVRPTLAQVVAGVLLGLGLAAAAFLVIDPGLYWIWTNLGWPTTNAPAFEKLLANLMTPIGALVIGVTAGIGEEMAVRGLLQPRIGLIASNLVFTSLHAMQYSFDGLLSVFLIGLALGIVRSRSNTSTSAIVHGVYNFTLVMTSIILAGQAG